MAALHLTADLDELTFGDLRRIVELTKDRCDDERVEMVTDEFEGITMPVALSIALDARALAKEGSCHGCE